MYTVELIELAKSYGDFVAVSELSLGIQPGEIFGLLGPNGAGKTSTIRMMIGITMPDSGEVRLFAEPFRRSHLSRVGYLPEERGLYRGMNVLEHLVFLAELKGVRASEAARRARSWCERLEFTEWLDKRVEELSKGMQQKVQFVGALLHDPEIIVMDEPFSGLDPANAVSLRDALLELKKNGKTILFSTHRMDQVERMCDSICLVHRGTAVLKGELSAIKAQYGRSHVHIEYQGDPAFLQDQSLVASHNDYGNYVEVRLAPGADSQELLRKVLAGARVMRFDVVEPSLEEIFIDVVTKPRAEEAAHA